MNRGIKVFIMVLVGLNLLMAGILIGNYSKPPKHVKKVFPPVREKMHKMSDQSSKIFEASMEEVRQNNFLIEKKIRQKREDIVQLMSAEQFDENMYQAAIDELHVMRKAQTQNLVAAAKVMAKEFSVEDRRVLAQLLKKPPHYNGRDNKRDLCNKQPPISNHEKIDSSLSPPREDQQ